VSDDTLRVRLLFVDDGEYRRESVRIPAAALDDYPRLIDCLLEDDAVLKRLHLDADRLCAAYVEDPDDD